MSEQRIVAEITGNVLAVSVAEGARVAAGDTVVLLESMKMEIPVLSETGGRVTSVAVSVGDVVHDGGLLAVVDDAG